MNVHQAMHHKGITLVVKENCKLKVKMKFSHNFVLFNV